LAGGWGWWYIYKKFFGRAHPIACGLMLSLRPCGYPGGPTTKKAKKFLFFQMQGKVIGYVKYPAFEFGGFRLYLAVSLYPPQIL